MLFAVFIIVSSSLPVQAALPASVATEADAAAVRGGLVVVLGTTDGIAEAALGADGSRLVQGLTLNDAALPKAREAIESKGRYGLVTVVKATTFSSLPYADGLVDLIVIGADGVGEAAPPAAELSRILSPNGVTLTWRKGAWERSIHPRSKEFDDWTHFDYDATGSGQSRDQRIAPPTHVQWAHGGATLSRLGRQSRRISSLLRPSRRGWSLVLHRKSGRCGDGRDERQIEVGEPRAASPRGGQRASLVAARHRWARRWARHTLNIK